MGGRELLLLPLPGTLAAWQVGSKKISDQTADTRPSTSDQILLSSIIIRTHLLSAHNYIYKGLQEKSTSLVLFVMARLS